MATDEELTIRAGEMVNSAIKDLFKNEAAAAMAQTEKKKRKAREFKKLLNQVEVGLGE